MNPTLGLLTCAAIPQLYEEEQDLLPSLIARGIDARPVVWSAPETPIEELDLVVFRSTWDYFEHVSEFRALLVHLEKNDVSTVNAVSLVRWNLDKTYLLELAERGVRIVPTRYFQGSDPVDVARVLDEMDWSRAIIKPAISGGAYRTYRVDRTTVGEHEREASALCAGVGLLVQPYLEEIERDGEWSLLFFEGVFSHAVVKTAAPAEFRIQPQFGGRFRRADPPANVLAAAKQVLAALPEPPLYARVDGVVLPDRELYLMEVELIEPYLFLEACPEAAERYVDALVRAVHR